MKESVLLCFNAYNALIIKGSAYWQFILRLSMTGVNTRFLRGSSNKRAKTDDLFLSVRSIWIFLVDDLVKLVSLSTSEVIRGTGLRLALVYA